MALGTISAVVVALSVGKRQVKAALDAVEHSHLLEEKARQEDILAVAEAGYKHSEMVRAIFTVAEPARSSRLFNEYHVVTTNVIVDALERIPAHELGLAEGIPALLRLRFRFPILRQAIEEYGSVGIIDSFTSPETVLQRRSAKAEAQDVHAKNVFTQLDVIRDDYRELMKAFQAAWDDRLGSA